MDNDAVLCGDPICRQRCKYINTLEDQNQRLGKALHDLVMEPASYTQIEAERVLSEWRKEQG